MDSDGRVPPPCARSFRRGELLMVPQGVEVLGAPGASTHQGAAAPSGGRSISVVFSIAETLAAEDKRRVGATKIRSRTRSLDRKGSDPLRRAASESVRLCRELSGQLRRSGWDEPAHWGCCRRWHRPRSPTHWKWRPSRLRQLVASRRLGRAGRGGRRAPSSSARNIRTDQAMGSGRTVLF